MRLRSPFDDPNKTSISNEWTKHIKLLKTLGGGITAITVLIRTKHHQHFALKLMTKDDDADNEVRISKNINVLAKESIIFNKYKGWQVCRIPDEWKQIILCSRHLKDAHELKEAIEKNRLLTSIVMELNAYKLGKVELNTLDITQMIFLLLHGIGIARKIFPYFRHRDIHLNNIMLQENIDKDTYDVHISKYHFRFEYLRYIPKLIDFGEAQFSYEYGSNENPADWDNPSYDVDNCKFEPRNDLYRIKWLFSKMLILGGEEDKILRFFDSVLYDDAIKSPTNDYKCIEKVLTHGTIFKQFLVHDQNGRESPNKKTKCFFCCCCCCCC